MLTRDFKNSAEYLQNQASGEKDGEKLRAHAQQQYLQLASCYVLGDSLQAEGFRNSSMDNLVAHIRFMAHDLQAVGGGIDGTISYVFSNTCPGSPLRRLLVDSCGACDL